MQDKLSKAYFDIKNYLKHDTNCQLNLKCITDPCEDCEHNRNGCYDDCTNFVYKNTPSCPDNCPDHIPDCNENCDEVKAYCESQGKLKCTCGLNDKIKEIEKIIKT